MEENHRADLLRNVPRNERTDSIPSVMQKTKNIDPIVWKNNVGAREAFLTLDGRGVVIVIMCIAFDYSLEILARSIPELVCLRRMLTGDCRIPRQFLYTAVKIMFKTSENLRVVRQNIFCPLSDRSAISPKLRLA